MKKLNLCENESFRVLTNGLFSTAQLLFGICCLAIVNDTRQSEITVSNVYTSDKVFLLQYLTCPQLNTGCWLLAAVKKSTLTGFLITFQANRRDVLFLFRQTFFHSYSTFSLYHASTFWEIFCFFLR